MRWIVACRKPPSDCQGFVAEHLSLAVETNHLGNSKRAWPRPPCTDAVLPETCHHMHDRSSRSGGCDGQEFVSEGSQDSAHLT
jgi:hypothetical protein